MVAGANTLRDSETTVTKSTERKITISGPNGSDNFVYVFTANFSSYMEELGTPSKPPKKLKDTRACQYRISTFIQREGFFVTAAGRRVPLNEVRRAYGMPVKAFKGGDFIDQLLGKHAPCNDFVADYNQKKSQAKAILLTEFDTFMLTDVVDQSVGELQKVSGDAKIELLK